MPVAEIADQIEGTKKRIFAVSASASDGSKESRRVSVDLLACPPDRAPVLRLLGQANLYHADTLDFAVTNAADFEGGGPTYEWSFGDGTTLSTSLASVSHDYRPAARLEDAFGAYDVSVTVRRANVADAAATRTFVVWSTYAQGRARGVLEPPAEPVDPVLRARGPDLVGRIRFQNLEPEPLAFTRRRVDTVPCDPDAAKAEGAETVTAVDVPAGSTVEAPLTLPTASVPSSVCSVIVHFWGTTPSGKKAQSSVVFDREGRRGNGATVDEPTGLALQYVTEQGLTNSRVRVTEEELVRLYRERRLPASIYEAPSARLLPRNVPGGPARQPCNPDDPSDTEYPNENPGFTCQPTRRWEGNGPGETPLDERVANASDFCAEDAKDSSRWEDPGTGIAVAPDDLLNHYDSPLTGRPYGYDERIVFRGKDYRAVYEWQPAAGSVALTVGAGRCAGPRGVRHDPRLPRRPALHVGCRDRARRGDPGRQHSHPRAEVLR